MMRLLVDSDWNFVRHGSRGYSGGVDPARRSSWSCLCLLKEVVLVVISKGLVVARILELLASASP